MIKVGDIYENRVNGRVFKVTRLMKPKNKPAKVTHVEFNGGMLIPVSKLQNFRLFKESPRIISKEEQAVPIPYSCPHCPKTYKTKSGLTRHIKAKHK